MNFVCFSPQFPPNFRNFWIQLNRLGANVLGLADAAYDELDPALKAVLLEYYRVQNAHNYDQLVRAMGYSWAKALMKSLPDEKLTKEASERLQKEMPNAS